MFKLIKDRWNAYTPKFFKRIVVSGCSVGGFGLLCVPFSTNLPAKLQPIPGYFIAIGLAAAGVAKLTKQDDGANQFLNSGQGPAVISAPTTVVNDTNIVDTTITTPAAPSAPEAPTPDTTK